MSRYPNDADSRLVELRNIKVIERQSGEMGKEVEVEDKSAVCDISMREVEELSC